jgi:O-antigen ligase
MLAVSTVLAVGAGSTELINTFAWSRVYLIFTFFYVVIRLFADRDSICRLLGWATALAAVTGFVALLIALSSGPESFFQDPSQQFIHTEEGLGLLERVRLPGLSLAYALFWYAVVRAVQTRGRSRLMWSLALVGMGINIALSFNRNMWLGLAIGLLMMLALSGPLVRRRLLGALAVLALAIVVIGTRPGPESKLTPLIARGTSLTNSESLFAESSLQSRANETEIAWNVALHHPVTGIGPGVEFGVAFFEATAQGVWVRVPQLFLHNQYLYLMLIGGIPALVAFLVFLLTGLRAAWAFRTRTPETAALGVGLASIMASAVVAIYFSVPDMAFAISLLAGAIFAARNVPQEAAEPPR